MKHRIVAFVMACLLVCVSAFTAGAQDAVFVPETCDADQLQQVTDIALEWGDQMNTVAQKTYDEIPDGNIVKMLDWGDLYVTFFNDIYPNLPTCTDGVIYGNAVGLMLNRQMNLETMIVLNSEQNATETGDADVNEALQATFDIQDVLAKVGVSAVNAVVTQVQSGTGIPGWLPACTADQTETGTRIADLEQTYADLQPALEDYLENGTVDKDSYITMLNLVTDTATLANDNPEPCADDYFPLLNSIYLYGDTLTTLTLGQIAPYMSENVNADRFTTLLQFCNEVMMGYLPEATATEES